MCLQDILMLLLNNAFIIIAIISAPLIALGVTNILEDRREKRNDKITLLKALMAYRKNDAASRIPLSKALNMIDVVFHEDEEILKAYHAHRDALLAYRRQGPPQTEQEAYERQKTLEPLFVEFVSLVVQDLNYPIEKIDIHHCIGEKELSCHVYVEKAQETRV